MTITYRTIKGSELTYAEVDENFATINAQYESVVSAVGDVSLSAASAANSALEASQSAISAGQSADSASSSAAIASSSASSAAASNASAAGIYDQFDDRYLGSKSVAPTTDNDGNPIITGALYWNSTSSKMFVWDGSKWVLASSGTTYYAANLSSATTLAASLSDDSYIVVDADESLGGVRVRYTVASGALTSSVADDASNVQYRSSNVSEALDKMTFYAPDRPAAEILAAELGDGATVIVDRDETAGGVQTRRVVTSGVLGAPVNEFDAGQIKYTPPGEAATDVGECLDRVFSPSDRIGVLAGKMRAGATVSIACYGDSTTDGVGTTSWVRNPVNGDDSAAGTIDHAATAPNAWPANMQAILRDMHGNSNINVWNAGYTNQKIESGWAFDNYQAAVIDNPFYGVPDILMIQFGINDSVTAGSQIDTFVSEYRKLIKRVLADGTVPVLMTTDAVFSKAGEAFNRPAEEVQRELNSCIKSLGKEFDVPVVDMYDAERKWLQDNNDGFAWYTLQSDTLHLNDTGHKFKAQIPAMLFFNDAAEYSGGDVYVNSVSSQVASVGRITNTFIYSMSKEKFNYVVTAAADGTVLMTMWVWNTCNTANLFYLGIATEAQSATTLPRIVVKDFVSNSEVSKSLVAAHGTYNPLFGKSDIPYNFGRLKYGLNKVTYLSSDGLSFPGGFRLIDTPQFASNALMTTGRLQRFFEFGGASQEGCFPVGETGGMSNAVSMWSGGRIVIKFTATIPHGGGIVLLSGQGYASAVAEAPVTDSVILWRDTAGSMQITTVRGVGSAVTVSVVVEASKSYTWPVGPLSGRVEIYESGGFQVYEFYDTWLGTTPTLTFTATKENQTRFGGYVGGIFGNAGFPAASITVDLAEMIISRS